MINYDRPFIVYIPIYLRIRSLEVNVAALMNVGLLLYITHNWLVSHRYYLAVCFWSASFRIPPSLRLFNTVVRRFAASIRMLPLKGARKVRIRARTRVAIKARVKGKVMIGKVDRSRSPPFRLVRCDVSCHVIWCDGNACVASCHALQWDGMFWA